MYNIDNYTLRLFSILENSVDLIINNPYLTGIGYGWKTINGKSLSIPTITFFVKKKLPPSEINPYHFIPKYVNGVISDVIEDDAYSFSKPAPSEAIPLGSTEYGLKPAYAGLSISNSSNQLNYGTIGYPVTDPKKQKVYILSSARAITTEVELGAGTTGGEIIYPAKTFGGIPPTPGKKDNSYIASLSKYNKLKYRNSFKEFTGVNDEKIIRTDAAIALVGENTSETRKTLAPWFLVSAEEKIVSLTGIIDLTDSEITKTYIDDPEKKKIWSITCNSKKRKWGEITALFATKQVIANGKYMIYTNQISVKVENTSQKFYLGDQGALGMIKDTTSAFGMLAAITEDGSNALFTPIKNVLNEMGVILAMPKDFKPTPTINPSPKGYYYI